MIIIHPLQACSIVTHNIILFQNDLFMLFMIEMYKKATVYCLLSLWCKNLHRS